MEQLQAFHNKKSVKTEYVKRVLYHYKADEIIHGTYWENGKGCAVGCTIHSSHHNKYETELGLPEWLARLEDFLFERMSNGKAKEFPLKLLKAIPIGANLDATWHKFSIFLLQDIIQFNKAKYPQVQSAIETVIALHQQEITKPNSTTDQAWSAARSAAESAARSAAWLAAESAARSAAESAARSAARSAAELAAESAARLAARSAAWSAARSAAWSAAWSAAESAAIDRISNQLIKLLKESKPILTVHRNGSGEKKN